MALIKDVPKKLPVEPNITSVIVLQKKMPNLSLIIRKCQKLKLRGILQNNLPLLFKNIKVMKDEERLEKGFRVKNIKERWQLEVLCDPELGHRLETRFFTFTRKDVLCTIELNKVYRLNNRFISVFISWYDNYTMIIWEYF